MNIAYWMVQPGPACFFCGVDSRAAAWFLGMFVLSLVLASVSFLLWAAGKGDFQHLEATALDPLQDPEPLACTGTCGNCTNRSASTSVTISNRSTPKSASDSERPSVHC